MNLIQGAKNLFTGGGDAAKAEPQRRRLREHEQQFADMSFEEKCGFFYRTYRTEDRSGRLALNRTWFITALYFSGKQNIRWNAKEGAVEIFEPLDGQDQYIENQFRPAVWANVKELCRLERPPTARPSSDSPDDVESAATANMALDTLYEDVEYPRVKVAKYLSASLFGNALVYNGFQTDRAYGITMIPKYKYEQVEMMWSMCPACMITGGEDTLACPQCGKPMTLMPPEILDTKIEDGFEERAQGRNISIVATPLEIYVRSKAPGGLKATPYLIWSRRMDRNVVEAHCPGMDITGSADDEDQSAYYIDVLSTLSSGPGDGWGSGADRRYQEVDYGVCWIRPELYRNDPALKEKYPDGLKFECVNGKYVPDTAENQSMDSRWTHYVYYPNPFSFWGEGMVDDLPVQDQTNETNSLITRYIRYCTMGKKLFDPQMITPEWLSNNPEEAWIPGNPQIDKKISEAVFEIKPTPLSMDVPAWRARLAIAHQEMTGAFDSTVGKSGGANKPYSSQVFEAERAAGRFLPMMEYNTPAIIGFARQLLQIFQDNGLDERRREFQDNAGKHRVATFTGADVGVGSFDLKITNAETAPMSRAERAAGLEMFQQLIPMFPQMTQKQKIYVSEMTGFPTDSNPETLQIQKANRDIQRIIAGEFQGISEQYILFINFPIYIQTFREFLAGQDGDALEQENPDAHQLILSTLQTAIQMMQMTMASGLPGLGAPAGVGSPPSTENGSQPANPGGQPQGPPQRKAQAPVSENQKVPMPPLPATPMGVPS